MRTGIIPYTLLPILLLFVESVAAYAESLLMFYIHNRKLETVNQEQIYSAEIWCSIAANSTWVVGDCDILIQFNVNALDPAPFNDEDLANIDPAIASGQQEAVAGIANVIAASISPPGVVAKTGGVDGSDFRIGTVRWRLMDNQGNQQDGITFIRTAGLFSFLVYRGPAPFTQLGFCDNINPINCDTNQYSLLGTANRVIDQSLVGCANSYYRTSGCTATIAEHRTITPVPDGCLRWPSPPTGGQHIAYYQYGNNLKTGFPARNRAFVAASLDQLLDKARCRWEKQLSSTDFKWETTQTGGFISWDANPQHFLGGASSVPALTIVAIRPDNPSNLQDSMNCGELAVQVNNRTEILLNNTQAYWNRKPHNRWTTNYALCGGGPDCLDFHSIILHELGHFLGLAHEDGWNYTMAKWNTYFGEKHILSQCDADKVRRLYSPGKVGQAPDNTANCPSTGIEEQEMSLEDGLAVYPNPVREGELTVRYTVPYHMPVSVTLSDALGNTMYSLAGTVQEAGTYSCTISVDNLTSGIYLVRLHAGNQVLVRKVVLVR